MSLAAAPVRRRSIAFLLAFCIGTSSAAAPPSVESLFGAPAPQPPIVLPLAGCAAPAPAESPCGRLLRARDELLEGFAIEAAADALRALQAEAGDPQGTDFAGAARLLHAEGLARAGRTAVAREALAALAAGMDAALAAGMDAAPGAVATLRLADLLLDEGQAEAAAAAYAHALPGALAVLGEAAGPWRLRAAEAALQAGAPDAALRWLDEAGGGADDPARALRRADALAAGGRSAEALASYRHIAGSGDRTPAARTARLRLAALGAPTAAAARAAIAEGIAAEEPAVAVYAASLGARAQLARGDAQAALAVLEAAPPDFLAPEVEAERRAALADALRAAVGDPSDPAGCLRMLLRGGGSLVSLARRAGAGDVAERARHCARQLGLEEAPRPRRRDAPQPLHAEALAEIWPALAAAQRTSERASQALGISGISPSR